MNEASSLDELEGILIPRIAKCIMYHALFHLVMLTIIAILSVLLFIYFSDRCRELLPQPYGKWVLTLAGGTQQERSVLNMKQCLHSAR